MVGKEKYIRYDEALTDNEILTYSQIINQFRNGEIDFSDLKKIFLSYGVDINPVAKDISNKFMTISEANSIKKRISEQKYLYNDINYFILNSNNFKNIVFVIDYKAIELLANHGIPEYQKAMISILMKQLNYSYNKNEKIATERSKWKRRIAELESQLSKNDNIDKKIYKIY